MCLIVLCTACMPMLLADETISLGDAATNGADADTLMGAIVGAILTIFRYIGVILLCWSVGQLILAFKDGDGNSKTQAAMMIVVSILLITLKGILKLVGIIN